MTAAPSSQALTTRLAPSPTGALHLGNARTFVVNWAMARQAGWRIVLRIEDLDTPRVKPETIASTVRTLEWLGVDWDEGPLIQSRDLGHHEAAMRSLATDGLVYPSLHSRTEVEEAASSAALSAPQAGAHDVAFPVQLRTPIADRPRTFARVSEADPAAANWRFAVGPGVTTVADGFAGSQAFDVSGIVGDFVVWTKRGHPAYQLAVVVDDHRQGVNRVVRGDDLLDSAARQLLLWRALRYGPEPEYTHLPLVLGEDGRRLAKRHGDTRVDTYRERGVPRERVLGLLAGWSGVAGWESGLKPEEFLAAFRLDRMPQGPVVFTKENDAWLLQGR